MNIKARFAAIITLCLPWNLVYAAPALTTIQDLLYKADGTRFNGTLQITWTGFQAADASNIATQSVTAPVSNGYLRVVLVPTTTAATPTTYNVVYNSDGRVQFTETWVVPPSATPLRVADVRSLITDASVAAASTQLQISDIAGLQTELNIRPTMGSDFAISRAAVVDGSGGIAGAAGNLSDCVHVDGTSGACGGAGGTDFAPPTSGTAILKGNGSGGFNAAAAGTDYQAALGFAPENSASKGIANGYAGLDGGGKYAWSGLSGVPSIFAPPAAGASTLGGLFAKDCSAGGQFIQKINTDGTETCATPAGGGGGGGVGDPGANGIMVRTALNTTIARSLLTIAPLSITNVDGTAGNPTLAISAASTVAAGSVQLAGDLGGTGTSPSVLKVNGNTPGGTCNSSLPTAIDSSGRPTCSTSVAVSGSVSTGSSPPVVTAGSGGLAAWIEGTAPRAGLPATGVDGCYGDATGHGLLCSFNNDSLSLLARASNNLSFFSSTTSAQLASLVSDATGAPGSLVFSSSPTLITPALGAATATTINKVTLTQPAAGSTLTIANGKTLTADNSIALAGTDGTTETLPSSSQIIPGMNQTNTGGASLTWDMSASAAANALKIPVAASAVSTANGGMSYDSTNNMLHAAQFAADAMIPQFTAVPANNDCAKWVVSGSNYKLGTAGAACGSGGAGGGYSTIDSNGTAVTQRPAVNFISGTNATVTCVDNSGATRTDCTVAATAGSGYSTVQGNGTSATQRNIVNFVGGAVSVVDAGGSVTQVSVDDPISTFYLKDNFACGSFTSGSLGCLGWYLNNTGFATGPANSIAGSPGLLTLTTSGTANSIVSISPIASSKEINSTETFRIRTKIASITGTNPAANIRLRIGITVDIVGGSDPPVNGFYLEKLETDTDWFCVVDSTSTPTRVDTGVAYAATATAVQIRRIDSTHIGCKVASSLGNLASAAEVSNAAAESTFDSVPFVLVKNTAAEAKLLNLNFWDFLITGLSR